jgi:hypothetical protein
LVNDRLTPAAFIGAAPIEDEAVADPDREDYA